MRVIKGKGEEEERREVSPAIPFHIICDPSLLTNLDLNISVSSNEQNPLDMLASQAIWTFENTHQAQLLSTPNQCSYEECGTHFHLVPEICTCCWGSSTRSASNLQSGKAFPAAGCFVLIVVPPIVQREIKQYPVGWQLSALGGTRQSTVPFLVVAPTILTMNKRRTSMTRRGGRWAQLN